ncbi:MAG: luciferase family protein [Methanospirillum sp.]
MPYYSEAESGELGRKVEEIVMEWPGVTEKKLFGSPAYLVGKTNFLMLVTGGIVLTRLGDQEKDRLLEDPRADYFVGHGRVIKKWVQVSVPSPEDLDAFVPCIRSSYETSRDEMA